MSDTVKLRYSSSANISFRGELDTMIPVEDWAEMSSEEQDEVIGQMLNDLVEISVVEP